MAHTKQVSYNKKKEGSGTDGQMYEIELSMLMLLQGIVKLGNGNISNFFLASNMEEAGDFDDAVFKCYYKDDCGVEKSKITFLQAKHKEKIEKEVKKISIETFLSKSDKGDFILRKYLSSFWKIRHLFSQQPSHPVFNGGFDDCELIIYTNAVFDDNKGKEHFVRKNLEANHMLYFEGESTKINRYYQLNNTSKVRESLKLSIDHGTLAKELTETILSATPNMNKPIFKEYHFALATKVIKRISELEGQFRKEFLEEDQELKNSVLQEIQKKKSTIKTMNDLNNHLKKLTIQLPEKFRTEDDLKLPLPNKLFSEEEIEMFLRKLKLCLSQYNERQLEEKLLEKTISVYNLEATDTAVFSDVREKIQKWWKEENYYLTEKNKFFQESARVEISFDFKPPNEIITGREEEIDKLHEKINRSQESITVISQLTSISGLGGIGKTELARLYIQKYNKNYHSNIIWINAENQLTLEEGFIRLAKEKLKIPTSIGGQAMSIETIIDEVYNFFSKRKCLFVFDNATNSDDFKKFLPFRNRIDKKLYILITSRDREWGKGIEVMDLLVLNLNDAIALVKKGLKINHNFQDEEIKKLVEMLQCFPLALRQAIAFIDNQMTIDEQYNISVYLTDYEKKAKTLLASKVLNSLAHNYTRTTFTTWKITIDKIRTHENGETALDILSLMSFMAPNNINRNMFFYLSDNTRQIKLAVRLLVKYSMISGEDHQSLLNIHRLVQEVIRIELNEQNLNVKFLHKMFELYNHIFTRTPNFDDTSQSKQLMSHLEVYLIHVENWIPQGNHQVQHTFISCLKNRSTKTKHTKLRNKYLKQLFSWLKRGKNEYNAIRTITFLEKELNFEKSLKRPNVSHIADITEVLGNSYGNTGAFQRQKESLEQVIVLLEKTYGSNTVEIVSVLEDLSETLGFLGNYLEQKGTIERSITIKQKTYGSGHPKVGLALEILGETYENLGDFKNAVDVLEQALKIFESNSGIGIAIIIRVLQRLAKLSDNLGNIEKRNNFLDKVLKIFKEIFKKFLSPFDIDGIDITTILYILAISHGKVRDNTTKIQFIHQVVRMNEKTLKMKETQLKSETIETIIDLISLSYDYKQMKNYEEQKRVLEKALDISKKCLNPDDKTSKITLRELNEKYENLNNHMSQKEELEKSLITMDKWYGSDNIKLNNILLKLSYVCKYLHCNQEQKLFVERALNIAKQHYGSDSPKIISTLEILCIAYEDLKEYGNKESVLKNILEIKEKYYGPNDSALVITLLNLAAVYEKLDCSENKSEVLERALKISKIYELYDGNYSYDIISALEELIVTYSIVGDYMKVNQLMQRALKWKEDYYGPELCQICELSEIGQEENLIDQALKTTENYYGFNSVNLIDTLHRLRDVYRHLNDYNIEQKCLEVVLVLEQERYYLLTLTDLAIAYGKLNKLETMKELLDEASVALENFERSYGPAHYIIVTYAQHLAFAYGILGNHEKRKELVEKALKMKENQFKVEKYKLIGSLIQLSYAYEGLKNYQEQKRLVEQALEIAEKYYGYDHNVFVIRILEELCNACENLGDYETQRELLKKILLMKEKLFGVNHFNVVKTLTDLARVRKNLNDFQRKEELEDLLERALEITKSQSTNNYEIAVALSSLSDVYGSLGNFHKEKELLEQAESTSPGYKKKFKEDKRLLEDKKIHTTDEYTY